MQQIRKTDLVIELFELQEQFMISFWIKTNQIANNVSIGNIFIPLENLKVKIYFQNFKRYLLFSS